MVPEEVFNEIGTNRQRYIERLSEFLQIPSVSTDSAHTADVQKAAAWVLARLKGLGFQVTLHETERHPVVYGHLHTDPDLPTLLIYGHYDVQPPDPLDEWVTPPFSPSTRDGFIYARGATDNKGQWFTYFAAMEAILAVNGKLPINVKVLVEGEEEIGSPSLEPFLKKHLGELETDAIAISDGSQFAPGMPAITYGLRGLSYLQVDVQGPRVDLHSGSFGGLVANPVQVLSQLLAQLKSADGSIAIPGFYDDVRELESRERQEMAALPVDEVELKKYLGVDELVGEPDYGPVERRSARPTLDVNGIWGGFSGEGAKTIIPARAGAKVSMRLVPDQRASTVNGLFENFIRSKAPPGVKLQITDLHGSDPVLVERDQAAMQAAVRAIKIGFGKEPIFIREGGSIPIVSLFKELLGCNNILLMGWGRPDDGAHSPNERFFLEDFHCGIRSAAALLYELKQALTGSNPPPARVAGKASS
ncbi:MAG: dipeptidase [Deltaproteobacteria bacterium]|jgi:acetylornithine deacetylase/succinyl-diaminopimelate desuccinylase-like protein|nr:MAG: dipeptidase [Deltaproteobacteria bacterium]